MDTDIERLCYAIRTYCNNDTIITDMLKRGVDPNNFDHAGITPLHYICILNKPVSLAKLLIKYGADVNAIERNMFRNTPLHMTIHRNNDSLTQLLLEHGADLSILNAAIQFPVNMTNNRKFIERFQLQQPIKVIVI